MICLGFNMFFGEGDAFTRNVKTFFFVAAITFVLIQAGIHIFIEEPVHEGFCNSFESDDEVEECFEEREALDEEYEILILVWSVIPALALLFPLIFFSAYDTFGKVVRAGLFSGVILCFVFAGLRAWFLLSEEYALYLFSVGAFLLLSVLFLWYKELL